MKNKCKFPGCTYKARVKGYCINHYTRMWSYSRGVKNEKK